MSNDEPPRLVDRPKLAEALANLKEGLGASADPFFDGWKRARPGAQVQDNVAAAREQPVTADTIEQSPLSDALPTEVADAGDFAQGSAVSAQVPPHDERHAPTLQLDKVLLAEPSSLCPLAELNEGPASAPVFAAPHRSRALRVATSGAPLRDTIRVQVIRYPVFPKWALIGAAAFLLFAVSAIVLRAGYHPQPTPLVLAASIAPPLLPGARDAVPSAAPAFAQTPTEEAPPVLLPASSATLPRAPTPDRARPPPRDAAPKGRESRPRAPGFFREPGF